MNAAPRSSTVFPFCVRSVNPAACAAAVLQHAVTVAVGQPEAGQQPLRFRRRRRRARQVGRVPALVARGDRAEHRHGGAQEHRVGERLAVHRVRDRAPQLGAQQPRPRDGGGAPRPQVQPERVGVEAHADVRDRHLARVGGALQRRRSRRGAPRVWPKSIWPVCSARTSAFWSGTISSVSLSSAGSRLPCASVRQ